MNNDVIFAQNTIYYITSSLSPLEIGLETQFIAVFNVYPHDHFKNCIRNKD